MVEPYITYHQTMDIFKQNRDFVLINKQQNNMQCVVPENIHTPPPPPPMEGNLPYDPHGHPSGNSNLASYIALNFEVFETPPPPWNIQSLLWGEYGYFSGNTQCICNLQHNYLLEHQSLPRFHGWLFLLESQ